MDPGKTEEPESHQHQGIGGKMKYTHTNIVANDWKKLSTFYIEVFGCVVKPPERNLSGDWLDRATGLKNAKLRGVHLILPGHGDEGPTLEIFTYTDMENRPLLEANHTGFTHIAFEVDDVRNTLNQALAKGATKLGEVTDKVTEGVGTLTFIYFRDPEGNIVEILSWEK